MTAEQIARAQESRKRNKAARAEHNAKIQAERETVKRSMLAVLEDCRATPEAKVKAAEILQQLRKG